MNGLETDGRIYKNGGVKILPFVLIPLPRTAKKKKMMSRIMWKKLINPLKQLKKWNVPGNFQNITPICLQ